MSKTTDKKKRLRNKADKLYQEYGRLLASRDKQGKHIKPVCEVCGGLYFCRHHYFPKSMSSALRYDVDNGIALCQSCHFSHHNGNPVIHSEVLKNRGQEWHDDLLKKKVIVKTDIAFYQGHIDRLKKEIERLT